MPSTYTTNNGIELIATGEQSGTWGTTTNTNLSLLDTSLDGQITITLTTAGTSGAPNDLPISNGSASNGRNRLIIFDDGGDLGATAYVQLTPNDAEKIIYIRNSLSGSRSILVFQGTYSASNDYEIPAGTTAVIYFDGAGTGAVAANVFNNAYFDALNISGNATISGTASVSGNLTVDTNTLFVDASADAVGINETSPQQELHITSASPAVRMQDSGGTNTYGDFAFNGTSITLDARNGASDGAILFRGLGGGTATEYARFNANGRLGLGVQSPAALLHLGTSGPQVQFDDTDATGICQIYQATASFVLSADPTNVDANTLFLFQVDGSNKFQIDDKIKPLCGTEMEHTAVTSTSNAATIDLNDGDSFTHDLTENVTYTFSNSAASGRATAFILKVIQDATARTITWPASVDWAGGAAPTLSTGNNDVDVFVFYTNDGGTTYYGSIVGQDFA